MRHDFPYLTTKRFPANWALGDMIKAYARGLRKVNKRKGEAAEGGSHDDKGDDEEDNNNEDKDAAPLTKKRRLADDE